MRQWTTPFRVPLAALALGTVLAAAVPGTSSADSAVCMGGGNTCIARIDGEIVSYRLWVPV